MDNLLGQLVVSLAGRDKGSVCAIVGIADEEGFVLIADGRTRKVERPKKKKLKHLKILYELPDEKGRLAESRLTNRGIREAIVAIDGGGSN